MRDLILHADVRWLGRGKVWLRIVDLLLEIKTFLSTRNAIEKWEADTLSQPGQHVTGHQ